MTAANDNARRKPGRPRGSRDRLGRASRAVHKSEPYVRYMRAVGERLRELREEQDVSASELASALSIRPETIRHWEDGSRTPNIANLYRLAAALDVRIADIVEVDP
jgi:ribosome-binding protein aMBF1 (putative translation factor)